MNEIDELFTAMLGVVFAAVMLVAGGWYIDNTPRSARGSGDLSRYFAGTDRHKV